jgi:hypothetical protein
MRNLTLGVSIVAFILCSCGGMIGNIEKYSFPKTSPEQLKEALNQVYVEHPNLVKSDTTMYGSNDGENFYFVLNKEQDRIVFRCKVISYPSPNDQETELSLTSATTWGKTMQLASKINFIERRKYRRLFEKHILPKVKKQLKSE